MFAPIDVPLRRSWFVRALFPFIDSQRFTISTAKFIERSIKILFVIIKGLSLMKCAYALEMMQGYATHLEMKCYALREIKFVKETYAP